MDNKNFKIFYRVLRNKTTSAYMHSTRKGFNKRDDQKKNGSLKWINHERINQNLFVVKNKKWARFNGYDRNDIYHLFYEQTLKNYAESDFHVGDGESEWNLLKKRDWITQYIVGISPRWFEQKDIVKYDIEMTKWGKLTWGIKSIEDDEKLIEVFSNISKTIIVERDEAYKFQNFVGSIIHLDEKSPHMHMFFTNIDDTNLIPEISHKNEPKYNHMRDKIVDNINESKIIEHENEKISFNDRNQNNHQWWKENFADHMEKWLRKDWEQKIIVQKNKEQNAFLDSLKEKEEHLKEELNKEYLKFTEERKHEDKKIDFIQKNLGYFDIDDPETRKRLGLDSLDENNIESAQGEIDKSNKKSKNGKSGQEVTVIDGKKEGNSDASGGFNGDENKEEPESKSQKWKARWKKNKQKNEPKNENDVDKNSKVDNTNKPEVVENAQNKLEESTKEIDNQNTQDNNLEQDNSKSIDDDSSYER